MIEEKGPFLERLVKEALYGIASPPLSSASATSAAAADRAPPARSTATPIARAVGARAPGARRLPRVRGRLRAARCVAARPAAHPGARTPFFCSGCPHNSSSTVADDDARRRRHRLPHDGDARPGGRGQVHRHHPDGRRGRAVDRRSAVHRRLATSSRTSATAPSTTPARSRSAPRSRRGSNVTYKLLYNDTVAMTGGQDVEGRLSVAASSTRSLHAEGVRADRRSRPRIRPVTTASRSPPAPRCAAATSCSRPSASSPQVAGVTVLIHDQACAAELRRARKRGKAPDPPQQVLINERVCEGCGDCGEKSGCLSVEPVETEFGRKTRIHQASCNKDFSCLEGDCPSFLTVIPPRRPRSRRRRRPNVPLPEPEPLRAATTCASGSSASAARASSPSARCSAWRHCSTGDTRADSIRPG